MDWNRRDFIMVTTAAAAATLDAAEPVTPWQRRIRRIGQTNMTEHDPAVLDVEQWADYWASLKVDAVLISVTGILAFYPTKVPYHRKGKFLGDRDFFVHVDVDVLDPVFMPFVDTPEPGGLHPDTLTALLAPLVRHPRAVGMEMTIYDPRNDHDGRGAVLLADILERAFG